MKDLGDRSSPTGLGFLGSCYVHSSFSTLPSLCMVRGEWLHERVGGSGTWFAFAKVCGSILRGWSMCNLEVLKHWLLFGVVENFASSELLRIPFVVCLLTPEQLSPQLNHRKPHQLRLHRQLHSSPSSQPNFHRRRHAANTTSHDIFIPRLTVPISHAVIKTHA